VVVKKPLRSFSANGLKPPIPVPSVSVRPQSTAKLVRNNSFRVSRIGNHCSPCNKKHGSSVLGKHSPCSQLPPLPPPPTQPPPPPPPSPPSTLPLPLAIDENSCNGCLISPARHSREVFREPTPEPIIKRIVTRLQTPEPDIIERVN
jgi:hypothetical protein